MHLEERSMSGTLNGTKPIFPVPLSGQTVMFSATNCHSNRCDQGRGNLHTLPHSINPSRCSCENVSPNTGFNRLLLPATSHNDQNNLPASLSDSWLRLPSAVPRNNYETLLMNGFPLYGKFSNESYPSLDYALLASARRKNATRETTSTLKAWLNEHKKNPYPTKGEKIMLAILTKMTLTQVSTWFANARRRLKKENKMTWSPRKKTGEKKLNDKDGGSCASDSDIECMDVDVDGDLDVPLKDRESSSLKGELQISFTEKSPASGEVGEVQRPSVIRALESPTFNEIRDRFQEDQSPVNHLQKWVDGCFEAPGEYPEELTPPSTPIEHKVTTFTAQKLFEAFDAAKQTRTEPPVLIKEESYNSEPLQLIFSSRQPVCSTKEIITQSSHITLPKEIASGVITPQPSPKNASSDSFVNNKNRQDSQSVNEVKVQGLTTSRELEAVLALTNLCKT